MMRHTLLASAAVLALGIGTASAERVHHMSGQTASANVRTTGMQTRGTTFGQTQYSGRQGMALSTDRQTFSTGNRIRGERFEHRRFRNAGAFGVGFGVGVGYPGYAYGYDDDWGPGYGYGYAAGYPAYAYGGGCPCSAGYGYGAPGYGYGYAAAPVGVSVGFGVGPSWGWGGRRWGW